MSARRYGVVACALLAACHFSTVIGTVDHSDGAVPDAPGRSVPDAGDAGPRCPLGVAHEDLDEAITGLGPSGVALAPDTAAPTERFRLYYLDSAGALRMELRGATDYRRQCDLDLGAPPAHTLAGAPAVAALQNTTVGVENAVIVPARGDDGCLSLWMREETSSAGNCAVDFTPWTQVPTPPHGVASAAFAAVGGNPTRTMLAVTSPDGDLWVLDRRPGAPFRAAGWFAAPHRTEGLRVIGRPSIVCWGVEVHFFMLTKSSRGSQTYFQTIRYLNGNDVWLHDWSERSPHLDDPARTTLSALAHEQMWFAYGSDGGRVFVQKLYQDITGIGLVLSEWSLQTTTWAGELALPTAPTLGFSRNGTSDVATPILVAVPRGQRRLYVAPWRRDLPDIAFEAWRIAPDALQ